MSVSEQRSPLHQHDTPGGPETDGAAKMARMPAWKRGILERRKAKQSGPGTAGAESWTRAGGASAAAITASPSNQENRARGEPGPGPGPEPEPQQPEQGGAVLRENIAPLQENPFIKLEKERQRRRRRLDREASPAKPVQELLDLYNHMPGVRTIQADNIIIIESDPDYFGEGCPRPVSNGGGFHTLHSVDDLLARGGRGGVAEIRASEVVIYETAPLLSKSEENLSTLVVTGHDPARVNNGGVYSGKLQGQVSRLLEKFDQHYTKPVRSRSTENLLDSFSSSREKYSSKPLLLPKPPGLTAPFKHSQVPAGPKGVPREVPPRLQVSLNQEDEARRDSVSSPSHLKSTPLHSLNRSSFSPSPVPAVSDQGTKIGASDDSVFEDRSYTVSSYRKRFESVPTDGRQLTPKDASHWTAGSPKSKEKFSKDWRPALSKESKPVENGHTAHSELGFIETNAVSAKESVADWKMGNRDNKLVKETGSGQVPSFLSASSLEASKGTNTWKPKKEVDLAKTSTLNPETLQPTSRVSSPAKPSATPSEVSKQSHKAEALLVKATPNQCKAVSASTSLNDTFEILPAAPPDFSSIAEGDVQAQALANLKKQSKNSFVVVPKKKSGDLRSRNVHNYGQMNDETPEKPKLDHNAFTSVEVQASKISSSSRDRQRHEEQAFVPEPLLPMSESDSEVRLKENLNKLCDVTALRDDFDHAKHENTAPSLMKGTAGLLPNEVSQQISKPPAMTMAEEGSRIEEYLPITNIDDIVEPGEKVSPEELLTKAKLPTAQTKSQEPYNNCMQRKSGNTFTIVPQRKPVTSSPEHSNTKDTVQANGTDKAMEEPEPALAKLGMLLKKRYPLAEEIEVIGGYLLLDRSCLSKVGSIRKKLKISFNDSSLYTTFEYPSESSFVQEEESDESEDDEEERSSSFYIPRPNYTSSPSSSGSPLRTNPLVSALSNYTPKHAMQFNTWQEKKFEDTTSSRDDSLQDTETSLEDAMLTPADSSSHSDYSSEPALYF